MALDRVFIRFISAAALRQFASLLSSSFAPARILFRRVPEATTRIENGEQRASEPTSNRWQRKEGTIDSDL